MMQVLPNTGIFNDDGLDRLRSSAIVAAQDGLPEEVVYYLRTLEERFMQLKHEQKTRALREVGWKHVPTDPDA